MKILILNWRDIKNPLAGGAEISLFEHAKYWVKMGNEVTWFTSSFKGAKKEEYIDGINFIRQGSHFTVHLFAAKNGIQGRFKEFDRVIDCFHFIPFFTPFYIKKDKIKALVHEIAGSLWFENLHYPLSYIGFKLEPLFFSFYKRISFIVVSASTKKDLEKINILPDYIHVVHNGNKIQKVGNIEKEKYPTIIFLGRISKDKGIVDALDAFIEVKYQIKDAKLWILGKEEKEGYMQKLLTSYHVHSDSVKYFGFVNEKEKYELLKRAWVLIHPSHKEGWGLTIIEAASQGTTAVGYNVEGLRDSIRDKQTGLLTETNPTALAYGVIHLLTDKTLYHRLCKESILWAKEFTWEKSTKKGFKILSSS
jgi:glycosyltransferase involved in cell wall biosynthesis